jgi:hypothetical protein
MLGMKIENNKQSKCENCGREYNYTPEMYNLKIIDRKFTLCKSCIDILFGKLLRADVMYNEKIKSNDDIKRIERSKRWTDGKDDCRENGNNQ